ncbi:MAG: cupin domain-containing protein [Rhodothermales bacterium]
MSDPKKNTVMKDLLPWLLLAALTGSWLLSLNINRSASAGTAPAPSEALSHADPPGEIFQLDELLSQLEASGRAYLPFLNKPTLRTGLYVLPAGAEDRQQPHDRDEVYYVIQGRASMTVGEDQYIVQPGSVIFVEAHAAHRFHTIMEDLHVLVFFSEAPPEPAGQ